MRLEDSLLINLGLPLEKKNLTQDPLKTVFINLKIPKEQQWF